MERLIDPALDFEDMYQCEECSVYVVAEHIQAGVCLECCL
jgi:hypothetical protein